MADAIRAGGVLVDVRANLHTLTPDLARAKSASERTGRAMASEFSKAEAKALTLTKAVTALGGGMALLGVGFTMSKAIGTLGDFGEAMASVRALTRATGEEFNTLESLARKLGATTRYSATQAADAMGFLAMAGYDTAAILSATPEILNLATAGSLELAAAADIASNVLSGFGLQVSETARVVDTLAYVAATSNTSVEQMGRAMAYTAPLAKLAGISLEEAAVQIGVLGDAGIQGMKAGTGLNGVIAGLVAPSKQSAAILEKLGVSIDDVVTDKSATDIQKFTTLMGRLEEQGVTVEEVFRVFGRESGPDFAVLADGADKAAGNLEKMKVEYRGFAAETAKIKGDQLNGDIKDLASAAEEVVQAMGEEGLTGGLRAIVQTATGAFRGLSENMGSVTKAAEVLAFILAATLARNGIGSVTANLEKMRYQMALAQLDARSTGVAMTRMAAASTLATNAARGMWAAITGPAGIAIIAGLALGLAKVGTEAQTAESRISSLNKTLSSLDTVNAKIAEDTTTLKTLNDDLSAAIASQQTAIAATKRADIEAVTARITQNEKLVGTYKKLATAQLASAKSAVSNSGFAKRIGGRLGLKEEYYDGRQNLRTRTASAGEQQIEGYISRLTEKTGAALSKTDLKDLKEYAEYTENILEVKRLTAEIEAYNATTPESTSGISESVAKGNTKPNSGGGGTSEEAKYERDKLAALEAQHALRLAIIKDEQDLIEQLERAEEIERLTADYAAAGLKIDEARAKATAQVNEARDLELKITEQELEEKRALHDLEAQIDKARAAQDIEREAALRTELDILKEINDLKKLGVTGDLRAIATDNVTPTTPESLKGRQKDDDESYWKDFGDNAADAFKYGLRSAIEDGDWGDAFGDIMSNILDDVFSNAMDDLFEALSKIDWNGSGTAGGTGWGGLISTGLSFLGGKASGGSVKAGRSYTVGELGPERFVPDVNGSIVSNKDMTGGTGGQLVQKNMQVNQHFTIQGNMDNVTQEQLKTTVASAIKTAVPPMVDQRVTDRKMRGAY